MRLAGLELEIKDLAALDPASLDDDELQSIVLELHQLSSSLDAARASLVAAFDLRRSWADSGARSCAAFLSKETGRPKPECGSQVSLARRLRHLPLVAAAWGAGEISEAHVRRILAARNPRTAELLARDEAVLVDHAKTMAFHEFQQAMAYWELRADPDGADAADVDRRDRRRVSFDTTLGGMGCGTIVLDPVSAETFGDELRRIEAERSPRNGPESKRSSVAIPEPASTSAPPTSAGLTPSSRWLDGRPPCPRTDAHPDRCSRSCSAPSR